MTKNSTKAVTKADIYESVTTKIISAIEAGTDRWKMPWHVERGCEIAPLNATNQRAYRGVNVLILWAAAQLAGYSSPVWATYKQWAELGAKVKMGSVGTQIVFWKQLTEADTDEGEESEENGKRRRFVAKGFYVFNAAQVDGYDLVPVSTRSEIERIDFVERFVAACGADIRHGGSRAYYVPTADYIQMPPLNLFDEAPGYYGTLLHELVHWSGLKTRLDRNLLGRFKDESYAAEELVAELGAAFLCSTLGISVEPRPDHAAYIGGWLKIMRGDKRAIFTASGLAQKAADFLFAKQPEDVSQMEEAEERLAA